MNPTTDAFERRMAALEKGTSALAVASGQAAETLSLLTITQLGDEIVAANNLYGGTYQLFHYTFRARLPDTCLNSFKLMQNHVLNGELEEN